MDHARSDLYTGADSLQQNAPEKGTIFVQIIHPHHPQVGQRVRVVRQTGPEGKRQWVIELADQTCARIPLAWAVPAEQPTDPGASAAAMALWVDVTSLRKLATMVGKLQANKSKEVTCDAARSDNATANVCRPAATPHRTPPLGATVLRRAPSPHDKLDEHNGQATGGAGRGKGAA